MRVSRCVNCIQANEGRHQVYQAIQNEEECPRIWPDFSPTLCASSRSANRIQGLLLTLSRRTRLRGVILIEMDNDTAIPIQSEKRPGCLLPIGVVLGVIVLCLLVSFVRFEINRRAKFIDIRLDRRIAEEINALVEPELRSLAAGDADLGELYSWEPQFWSRTGPVWMGATEANWRLELCGFAHFEKADIYIQIPVLKGRKELVMKRTEHKADHIAMPAISAGASHPDFVQGPPYRSEKFNQQQ